jgi:hypothetical protein
MKDIIASLDKAADELQGSGHEVLASKIDSVSNSVEAFFGKTILDRKNKKILQEMHDKANAPTPSGAILSPKDQKAVEEMWDSYNKSQGEGTVLSPENQKKLDELHKEFERKNPSPKSPAVDIDKSLKL